MKNIFKKLLILLFLTPLLFLTGCGVLSSGGKKTYSQFVKVGEGEYIEFRADGINKKYGVEFESDPIEIEAVHVGNKSIITITGTDLGITMEDITFTHESREISAINAPSDQKRVGTESGTYLGGSNTNYEGQFRILESDYRLGVHIPQEQNKGVVVAIVGSGLEMNHPGYKITSFWQNSGESCSGGDGDSNNYDNDCYGWDFGNGKPLKIEDTWTNSHETRVAGVIIGDSIKDGLRGVNPNAVVMPVRMSDGSFPKTEEDYQKIANSVIYAADNITKNGGKCIINMSFGTSDEKNLFRNSLEYAYKKGCILFTSTGNSNGEGYARPEYYGIGIYPEFSVVGITGLDPNGTERYSGSSWANSVMFAAPVVGVYTTTGNDFFGSHEGTSYSSPIIAGLASLLWNNSVEPIANRQGVLDKLISKSASIGTEDRTGTGKIKVKELVKEYVDLSFKTVQSDIDNDGQLEQLKIELSTYKGNGAIHKGYITHIIDNGVQYSVFREI